MAVVAKAWVAKVVFAFVAIVKATPVPSESDISKFLLDCTFVKTQFPVLADNVNVELPVLPVAVILDPVVTLPAKVAFCDVSNVKAVVLFVFNKKEAP